MRGISTTSPHVPKRSLGTREDLAWRARAALGHYAIEVSDLEVYENEGRSMLHYVIFQRPTDAVKKQIFYDIKKCVPLLIGVGVYFVAPEKREAVESVWRLNGLPAMLDFIDAPKEKR